MLNRLALATGLALLVIAGTPLTAAAQTLKIATLAPEGSQWVADMREGAKAIKARTGGRVQLKIYAGGVMGNDAKVLKKMRFRQLHGAYFTATGMQELYPDINIYGLPFVYNSEEEIAYVRARVDERLVAGLRDAGFESFGFSGGGFARLMSQTPVTSLEDLNRQKVWVPEGDNISYEAMRAMGLAPVTLPVTDVLTGLQSGLLDIVGSPPVAALVLQWHTKVKYVTDLPLVYTIGFLALDKKAFAKLSADDQKVVREVLTGVSEVIDAANRADDSKAMAALEGAGLTFVNPDPAAVEGWRQQVLAANARMAGEGLFSASLYAEVLALLDEYRASAGASTAAASD